MDWVEQINTRAGTGDKDGGKTDERYFSVWGANARACVDNPATIINSAGVALPGYRSAHPDNPALKLDRYSTSTNGVVVNLTAMYSNNGRYGSATPRATPVINEPSIFSASFRRSEEMIPFARRVKITYPTVDGEDLGDFWAWELSEVADDTELLIYEYEAVFPSNQFATGTEAIRVQCRKIHKFGDRFYRFQGGNVRANADGTYTAAYSWLYDPGVPDTTPGYVVINGTGGQPTVVYPSDLEAEVGESGPLWVRPPFHGIVAYRDSNDATVAPNFEARLRGTADLNGWQSLPGLVL